jgi:hypothetical protein
MLIVLVLWLLVAWQFIETFPRLDLWIAFWVALAWMRRESENASLVRREHDVPASTAKGLTPLGIVAQ